MTPVDALIAVDTGGTFTDFVWLDGSGQVHTHKEPSTPHRPEASVLAGVRRLLSQHGPVGRLRLVHGSTVATNALLEGKHARTALLTTAGCEDLLAIGRQNRPELYARRIVRPEPVTALALGVHERVAADGRILEPLDFRPEPVIDTLRAAAIESVAVCLLFSYLRPEHERTVGRALRAAGFDVSLSSEVLPEHREFERAATTALNAAVAPVMRRYLRRLARGARALGCADVAVMLSSGGLAGAAEAARHAVHTVLSGPAGGAVGAARMAEAAGTRLCVSFDMGGTSTDVALIDGEPVITTDAAIAGWPVRIPVVDVHTVGAGGGSIARIDEGGALRVGPASAGADPGPACYGRGGERFTVTDANVLLGLLPTDAFLGGQTLLDPAAAETAARALAARLGATTLDVARGVRTVVAAQMGRALRRISVERGRDPEDCALLSFGGAGGLHAVELAEELGIPRVLIPPYAGVLSAFGMAVAPVQRTYAQSCLGPLDTARARAANKLLAALRRRASADLRRHGVTSAELQLETALDLRYSGQSYELTLPLPGGRVDAAAAAANFARTYDERFGYTLDQGVELVAVRLLARGPRPGWPQLRAPDRTRTAPRREVRIHTQAAALRVPEFGRSELGAGAELVGPALIVEAHTTLWLPPRARLRVLANGILDVAVGPADPVNPSGRG
ncbi:MAG TPA: hydantoinase/oxoprolinase family protein [Limnochordia bacterium]|nr:hydantoinase/oxoprolinase family protein [Limnochordia bacterium]